MKNYYEKIYESGIQQTVKLCSLSPKSDKKKYRDLLKYLKQRVSVKKYENQIEKKPLKRSHSFLSYEMGLYDLGEQKLSN